MANRERDIFLEALEMGSPEERAAFLRGACREDEILRREVERLLGEHGKAIDFFQEDSGETAIETIPLDEGIGSILGRYKLLEKIGEGGFGIVYMAEQREPIKRRVALKIIKLGMDTKQVVGRFEAERQALAMLDHPHIAKVLDAGATDTGRPYFVMELVRGLPLMAYCDEHRLTIEARLLLFMQICQAISYAHQKGIIHRDIKPSNILVSVLGDRALPKVIDFGIAKATQQDLTDRTLFTRFHEFMGTPAYMSPEQAQLSSYDVDTRSDIYSLGVLLYQLLTGRTPFDAKDLLSVGIEDMRRRIREEEPPKPSTKLNRLARKDLTVVAGQRQLEPARLHGLLSGELEWIILKAMDKDRARRYESAAALAEDVQRYLNNEPVAAAAPSKVYRLQKFVRRNKLAFGAAAVVVLGIAAGAVGLGLGYVRAQEKARRAADTTAALIEMIEKADPNVGESGEFTVNDLLVGFEDRISELLPSDPDVEFKLRFATGKALLERSLFELSEKNLLRALSVAEQSDVSQLEIATVHNLLAVIYSRRHQPEKASPHLAISLQIRERELGTEHSLSLHTRLTQLQVNWESVSPQAGLEILNEIADIARKHPGERSYDQLLLHALFRHAKITNNEGDFESTDRTCAERLQVAGRLFAENHPTFILTLSQLAESKRYQRQWDEALALLDDAEQRANKWFVKDDATHIDLLLEKTKVYRDRGDVDAMKATAREAIERSSKTLGEDHRMTRLAREMLGEA